MKSTKILYIGRHSEIMEIVVRLINANENWEGIGAKTDEEAMRIFQKENIDIEITHRRISCKRSYIHNHCGNHWVFDTIVITCKGPLIGT